MTGPFQRVARNAAFARHIPIRKMMRRAGLMVRRGLADRNVLPLAAVGGTAGGTRADNAPQPILPQRVHLAPVRTEAGWRFTFLNRSVDMTGAAIDWSAPGPGSAAQLWRMNLHYMEYLEGVDDATWANLVEQWIDAHPTCGPGAWRDSWNSYALSIRVVVWMQELARRAAHLPSDAVARAERSVLDQVRFLMHNLETDLGGNHLIKNIKALIWASGYFVGPEPMHWRSEALNLLLAELGRQILPDGMHAERSPSYHAQVFADLLECRHVLRSFPGIASIDAALHRMAQATADLAHPDGGPALFNDSGMTMAYAPAECLAAYERLLGRHVGEHAVFAYCEAGYYGLRSNAAYLVADCGRIGPDELPAHGHGDVLSFEWSVAGERIVVDQGVFEYVAGPRRQKARHAASHNTLSLDGADQADFFGAFRCGRRPNIELRHYEPNADGFVLVGSHDGYCGLPGRPRHVRRFDVSATGVMIVDKIEGGTARAGRIGLLLHPDVNVSGGADRLQLARGAARVIVTSSRALIVEPAVWWPDMGVERPTQRLVIGLLPGAPEVTTTLRICAAEAAV